MIARPTAQLTAYNMISFHYFARSFELDLVFSEFAYISGLFVRVQVL